jgi:crotonobetainyl-CoA:carnitine CoA-transferase CaiB-like acyl-CoA transferase
VTRVPAEEWAQCGAMAPTGTPDGAPLAPAVAIVAHPRGANEPAAPLGAHTDAVLHELGIE